MTKHSYDKPISHEQKTRTASGLSSLLWMLVGALIAVMIGVFLYLSPLFDGFKTEVDVNPPTKVELLPQKEQVGEYEFYEVLPKREFHTSGSVVGEKVAVDAQMKTTAPDAVVKAAASSTQKNTEVDDDKNITITEEDITYDGDDEFAVNSRNDRNNIKISSTPSTYILQIRSYDNPEDADRMRAAVMMAGVDARIVKRVDNDVVLYQVISNVMSSKQDVMHASQRLSDSGIDSLVVEQKY